MNKINLVFPVIFYLLVLISAITVSVLAIPNRAKIFNLAILTLLSGVFAILYWPFVASNLGWGLSITGVLGILTILVFEALLLTSKY